MKIAVVAGGWHWPADFFQKLAVYASGADLFAVAHRNPELPIVREEKREILEKAVGPLAVLDRHLYSAFPTVKGLREQGWQYLEEPNTFGDWEFLNQWLARFDYRKYDVILNCHDDTFVRGSDILAIPDGDWWLCANGRYPEAPLSYVRGSFEFWKRELLDAIGGRIELGHIRLRREGKTDSLFELGDLAEWNNTCVPLRNFMQRNGNRVDYLSPYYRISSRAIEGERGFVHFQGGASWSYAEGRKALTEYWGNLD